MREVTKIELSEKDIKELVAEKFNLDPDKTTCRVSVYEGDRPDMSTYTTIIVEGEKRVLLPYNES